MQTRHVAGPVARSKKRALNARNIVVIAGSAGGIEALCALTALLPRDLEAAIVIAQHISRSHPSHLAEILRRCTALPVQRAANQLALCHGCIFVAPPDHHVLVENKRMLRLSKSAQIHHARPSAEPLFCSAAAVFGKRVIGVVLTGADADASLGVQVIKSASGKVIAQNKETSQFFSMPHEAIETGKVDLVLPLDKIANAIVDAVNELNTPSSRPAKKRPQTRSRA